MTLNSAVLDRQPATDELVPSRYALQVGEIEVLVVSDGILSLPNAMLAHNVGSAAREAWLEDMFLPRGISDWPLNVVVVRSGDRIILIDAGLGADPSLGLPRAGRLVQRLQAAGIDLASVTDVILTHLHMDHIGGLLVDAWKKYSRSAAGAAESPHPVEKFLRAELRAERKCRRPRAAALGGDLARRDARQWN